MRIRFLNIKHSTPSDNGRNWWQRGLLLVVFAIILPFSGYAQLTIPAALDSLKANASRSETISALLYGQEVLRLIDVEKSTALSEKFNAYQQYLAVVNQFSNQIPDPETKKIFYQLEFAAYEKTIALCYEIYQQSSDLTFFEYALNLAERNRNVLLVSSIRNSAVQIPQALIQQEGDLLAQINKTEEQLRQEKASQTWNTTLIDSLEQRRDDLLNQYETFKQDLASTYPQYLKKEKDDTLHISHIQQDILAQNEAVIEFFYGKKEVFAFIIKKEAVHFLKIGDSNQCSEMITEFRQTLRLYELENLIVSYELYNFLIKPLLPYLQQHHLQIINDGPLGYLPLEALVTAIPDDWDYNYKKLPYFVYDFQIAYQHSIKLFTKERLQSTTIKNPKLVTFSPIFTNTDSDTDSLYTSLATLQTSSPFLKKLDQYWRYKPYHKEAATPFQFKTKAYQYDLVHLATHTLLNHEQPLKTAIAFAHDTSGYYFYLEELYQMQWQTDLVVLGSCETGSGTYEVGNGIMSLAYGFSFAGVPSQVYSLWKVDEHATTDLLLLFYKNLKKGLPKDAALHQAKLDYLQSANEIYADPYYWAGFVMHGETSRYEFTNKRYWWWIGLGLLAVVFIAFLKKQKSLTV